MTLGRSKKSVELCVDVWRFHWLAIMLLCVCVLWSYLPRFQTFLNARSLPQFFGEIMQRCDINIYIYICMYVNILGLFSRWMWYKKHRACSKDSFFIFLQCLQDYAIWLMTARCLALDDGSRASSSGSQCAIAPVGDKLHSIPIDKLMEVGGSAIHSCCSRASTDTDRWQSPLGAFQFCFDNWNHSCFSAGAVIFNKREKTLSQQSFTHD